MNANELIKYWDNQPSNIAEQTATMLRQQQAEIKAFEKENEELSALCVEFNVLRKSQEVNPI